MGQLKIEATKDKTHPDLEDAIDELEDAKEKHAKAKTNRDHRYDELVAKMQSKHVKRYTTSDGKRTVQLEASQRLVVTKVKPNKSKDSEDDA